MSRRLKPTKNDMARVIVQALYNLDALPAGDDKNVKRYKRWKKEHLEPEFRKAHKIIMDRTSKPASPGRGGPREGAGRPSRGNLVKFGTTLPEWLVRWLNDEVEKQNAIRKPGNKTNKARLIEVALIDFYNLEGKNEK